MKPTLDLYRKSTGEEGTFGILFLPSKKLLNTVELPWRDNMRTISCIPAGIYNVSLQFSPKFKSMLYELDNQQTAPRSEIKFHVANFGGDATKGWQKDLDGCIGLGLTLQPLMNKNHKLQKAVAYSKDAMLAFNEELKGQPFILRIHQITAGISP